MERKDLKMSRIPLRIQNFGDLPNEALISAKEICLLSGRSRSSLWRDVKKSRLPKPISIGSNSVRWPAGTVREYLFGGTKSKGVPYDRI